MPEASRNDVRVVPQHHQNFTATDELDWHICCLDDYRIDRRCLVGGRRWAFWIYYIRYLPSSSWRGFLRKHSIWPLVRFLLFASQMALRRHYSTIEKGNSQPSFCSVAFSSSKCIDVSRRRQSEPQPSSSCPTHNALEWM